MEKKNKHNFTYPISYFPINRVTVGKGTYGGLDIEIYGAPESQLVIGSYCSIAQNVRFILDGEHNYKKLSTYPFQVRYKNIKCEALSKGKVIVGDDVWIGERSLILSGVTIGQGAVIGAGSIVRSDIPPYAIYVGNQVVKYRFKSDWIEKLIHFNYSSITADDLDMDLMDCDLGEAFFETDFYRNHCYKIEN